MTTGVRVGDTLFVVLTSFFHSESDFSTRETAIIVVARRA